jgi:predicted ATPase/DNA-binding XRE family transcriptional regulator
MEATGRPHFGALLRQFRLDAGITQQELAERAKLSVEAISTLERGVRTRPHRDTVILLGAALELSPEREALFGSAIGIAHSPRRRDRNDALNPSMLRIVWSDTRATPRHNLAQQLTSFVGRLPEIREIGALLQEHRLVTIVGAGGVGKTRVAMQLGGDLLDACPDGVWLVDLAPLVNQTQVASVVLSALQLPSTTGSAIDAVVAYLETRKILLILDNCEHVIAAARQIAASIAQSCPYVRILSTSRQALEIGGERVYRLPSLGMPPNSRETPQDVLSYDAVTLFIDRARAVDASFLLTNDNAPDVADICRRLDGIPLAIELAAARVNVLAPRQIVKRLDQRFRLLGIGECGPLPRHQTMTALMDWSYDLLTPREQRFFESFSVFPGGCTLEAAASVCATDGEDDLEAIELITSLVTKSLLVAELAGDEHRYWLLESSRQYARGKLIAGGAEEQLARRHAVTYLELGERLERLWNATLDREWLPQVQAELENWRGALEWALGQKKDVTLGQHLVSLRMVFLHAFPPREARCWVQTALELADESTPPLLLARLEHADAEGAANCSETKVSLAAAERALVRYRDLQDGVGAAHARSMVARALVVLGRFAEAEPLLREALGAARSLHDLRLSASVLRTMGTAKVLRNDYAGARDYYTEALELAKLAGAEFLAATIAVDLADTEADAGDPETALRLIAAALPAYRAVNPSATPRIASAIANMAQYLIVLGRYDEARMRANEALAQARGIRSVAVIAACLLYHALAAVLQPQTPGLRASRNYTGATHLLGFVAARMSQLELPEIFFLPQERDRALAILRDAIGADEVTHLMAAGAAMTEDEAIAQAHALE